MLYKIVKFMFYEYIFYYLHSIRLEIAIFAIYGIMRQQAVLGYEKNKNYNIFVGHCLCSSYA